MNNQIDEAIEYILNAPYPSNFKSLDDAIRVIGDGFDNRAIESTLVPRTVDGLIRALMQMSGTSKEKNVVTGIFQQATSAKSETVVVEKIVQTLIAASNNLVDYSEAVTLLSQFVLESDTHPVVLKTLIESIQETNSRTTEIIVRATQQSIRECRNINQKLYALIFSIFKIGSYLACLDTLETLVDKLKKREISDFQIEKVSSLWIKVRKAIYDTEYSPVNYQLIENSAKLLAIVCINNDQPINELPEPLIDLREPSHHFMVKGGNRIHFLILLNNAIENFYQQVNREKFDNDANYYFAVRPSQMPKIVKYYFGDLYNEWHIYWAEKE